MIPDDDGGGGTSSDYKSFANRVNVEVTDLITYHLEMMRLAPEAQGAASTATSEMNMLIFDGLNTPLENEILPEGQSAARLLTSRLADFQRFFADVTEGITNIGSAAAVVAEIYRNADSANGASLNDIDFVFGDYDARPPNGFVNRKSMDEWREEEAAKAGTDALSLTSDDSSATQVSSYPYGAFYTFSDGSKKHVHAGTEIGPNGETVYVSTTTYYAKDGTVVSTETSRNYETSGGQPVRSSTTSGSGRTSTSTTTENDDGSVTVRTETQSGDEDPQVHEETVHRDSHQEGEVEAPIGQAADDLESDGGDYAGKELGMVR